MLKASASKLKAKMGQYMKAVRAGKEVVVTDRDEPVAKLVPFKKPHDARALVLSQAKDPTLEFGALELTPIPYRGTKSLELLLEDRGHR